MRTTTMMLGMTLALAPAVVAQDQPDTAKILAEKIMKDKMSELGQTFEFMGGQLIGGSPVKGAPYSAEAVTESTQTLPDGNHIVNRSSSTLYRDSDGRERREESFNKLGAWNSQGEPARAIFISDPVAKTKYTLDSKAHTATKMGMSISIKRDDGPGGHGSVTVQALRVSHGGSEPEVLVHDGPDMVYFNQKITTDQAQSKKEELGKRIIEGVQTEGTRTTITIPAGQIGNDRPIDIVSERWYSPELQVTMLSRHSDPRSGETVYKLTGVNRSEPQRTLFEVPADYTIADTPMMRMRTDRVKEDN